MTPIWNWGMFEGLINLVSGRLLRGDERTWKIHSGVIRENVTIISLLGEMGRSR
jgi:hypothetical protein